MEAQIPEPPKTQDFVRLIGQGTYRKIDSPSDAVTLKLVMPLGEIRCPRDGVCWYMWAYSDMKKYMGFVCFNARHKHSTISPSHAYTNIKEMGAYQAFSSVVKLCLGEKAFK